VRPPRRFSHPEAFVDSRCTGLGRLGPPNVRRQRQVSRKRVQPSGKRRWHPLYEQATGGAYAQAFAPMRPTIEDSDSTLTRCLWHRPVNKGAEATDGARARLLSGAGGPVRSRRCEGGLLLVLRCGRDAGRDVEPEPNAWHGLRYARRRGRPARRHEDVRAHEERLGNQPQVSVPLGTCQLLHRRPWLANNCGFELHGVPAVLPRRRHGGDQAPCERDYRGRKVRSKLHRRTGGVDPGSTRASVRRGPHGCR